MRQNKGETLVSGEGSGVAWGNIKSHRKETADRLYEMVLSRRVKQRKTVTVGRTWQRDAGDRLPVAVPSPPAKLKHARKSWEEQVEENWDFLKRHESPSTQGKCDNNKKKTSKKKKAEG